MAKKDVKSAVKDAGKAAAGLINKAHDSVSHAIDVNGDGKFDLGDIKTAAKGVGDTAQKAASNVKVGLSDTKKKLDEKARSIKHASDLKSLRPVFKETLDSTDFAMPKLLMLVDGPDKAHKESEACEGSVGFNNKADKMDILTIYKEDSSVLGVSFYPDENCDVYYVDPTDRDNYISLKKYTEFLIIKRGSELQRIAQDLGAKSFSVRIVTSDASKEKETRSASGKVGKNSTEAKSKKSTFRSEIFDYTAKSTFLGQEPVRPELKYLAKDLTVQNLIDMRLHNNGMQSQTIKIQLSDTSGITLDDAVKIGTALKSIKCAAGAQFVKETETQSNSYFEYNIEF